MAEKLFMPPYDSQLELSTTPSSLFRAVSRSFGSLDGLQREGYKELIDSDRRNLLNKGEEIAMALMTHSSIPEDWRVLALLKCVMQPELMKGLTYPCYDRKDGITLLHKDQFGNITNLPSQARIDFLANASSPDFAVDVRQLLDDPDQGKIRVNTVVLQKALNNLFCDYSDFFVLEQGLFYLRLEADEKAAKESAAVLIQTNVRKWLDKPAEIEPSISSMKKRGSPRKRDPVAVLRDLNTILTTTHAPDSKVITDLIRLQDNFWYLAPELLNSPLPWNLMSMLLDKHTESVGAPAKHLFAGLYDSPELKDFQLESRSEE